MKNVACRIFKEQIDLINELPKEDRANVLYSAIMSAYNQFENQNEIQTENQIEYAYISLSISKSIFNLLSKNIVFKEYNNYGGKRENSGRPKKPLEKPKEKPLGLPSENLPENVNENENKNKKLKTEDINDFESLFTYWEQNKKGGKYKPESRQRMLNKLKELTNNDFEYAKKAIFYAIDNNYQGFTDGSRLYYKEKPTQKSLYEKCVENGLKFLEDTDD
jgi:hypothetical protein